MKKGNGRHNFSRTLVVLCVVTIGQSGVSEEKVSFESADALYRSGKAREAAEVYYRSYLANPKGRKGLEALIKTGRALDVAKLRLYEDADKKCYLDKRHEQARPECFESYVTDLNQRFGGGSFTYHGDQVQFTYNATHFRKALEEFPGSPFEDEARLMLLRGNELLGDEPAAICAKVDGWLAAFPKSPHRPKALLLLGRLHADAFVTFKRGGFILIDGRVDSEGIAMERSKHQQKGLAAFKEILDKYPDSPERKAAEREYQLLKEGKDDGIFYGISY